MTISWENSSNFHAGKAIFFNFLYKKCHIFIYLNIATFSLFFQFEAKTIGTFQTIIPKVMFLTSPTAEFFTVASLQHAGRLRQELALGLMRNMDF